MNNSTPTEVTLPETPTAATDPKLAAKALFEAEIERLENEKITSKGELIVVDDPEHGLVLECTSSRSVPEILKLAYPNMTKELKTIETPEPKRILSLEDERAQRPMNRAERRNRR